MSMYPLKYVVIFDPNAIETYVPPVGVSGGVMGETEKGPMAIYAMGEKEEKEFLDSVGKCRHVVSCKPIGGKKGKEEKAEWKH